MADPVVTLTNGVPTSGSGPITTLGQTLLDGANATMGVTTGAAVITDAAGALQQYLRGLVKLAIATGTPQASSASILSTQGPATTPSRINSTASTNATSIKGSAGRMFAVKAKNVAAYTVFLKLFDKATAPTLGTDTPVWTIPILAGEGYGDNLAACPYPFTLGIAYAITKLQADSDATVVAAGDLTGTMQWA